MNPLVEMERAVLGSMLDSPELVGQVFDRVPPEQWSGPHALIGQTLQAMNDNSEVINPTTVLDRLRRSGLLVRVGGGAYLHTLIAANGGAEAALYLVESLEVAMIRRMGAATGQRLLQRMDNIVTDPEEAIYDAGQELGKIRGSTSPVQTQGWPTADIDPEPVWVIPDLLAADEIGRAHV